MSTAMTGETAAGLRRAIYGKGDANRGDLDVLITKGAAFGDDRDFADLLAEVALEVLSTQPDPTGYVSDSDAAWLIGRLGSAGLAKSAELAMLKHLLGRSISVPAALTDFAVNVAKDAYAQTPKAIDEYDVDTLRALAFAPTAGAPVHISGPTAEALFAIAHATAGLDNDPEFANFFARAIGNYLMGAAFVHTEDAATVRGLEKDMDEVGSPAAFARHAQERPTLLGFAHAIESLLGEEEDEAAEENEVVDHDLDVAAPVDASEGKWVLDHLSRGALCPAERRLLAFLRDEAPSAPPELTALYDQAA